MPHDENSTVRTGPGKQVIVFERRVKQRGHGLEYLVAQPLEDVAKVPRSRCAHYDPPIRRRIVRHPYPAVASR